MFFENAVHAFDENGVFRLEKLVAWFGPFLDRFFDKPFGDDEGIIIGKLAGLGSTFGMRGWTVERGKFRSPQRQVHDLVHIYSAIVRAQLQFLGREEGGGFVVQPCRGFVRTEVRCCILDSTCECCMEGPYGLVDSIFVGGAINVVRQRPREAGDQLNDLGDWVLGRWLWQFSQTTLCLSEDVLQLVGQLGKPEGVSKLSMSPKTPQKKRNIPAFDEI